MTALHGTYRARAVSGGLGFAGNGTERLGIDFLITDGPSEGQHVTWWGFFTPKTAERTIESLRIMGWQGDDLCDLTGIDQNPVDLVIEAEEYEDKRTGELKSVGRVRWVNRPGGLQIKDPMSPSQAREFAARMRGTVVALGGPRKPAAPNGPAPVRRPAAAPAQAIDIEDDIPFICNTLEYSISPTRRIRWQRW